MQASAFEQQVVTVSSEQRKPLQVVPKCLDIMPSQQHCLGSPCSLFGSRDAHCLLRVQGLYTGRKERASAVFQAAVEEVIRCTLAAFTIPLLPD